MAQPFILISSSAIKPGKADEYLDRFREVAELVEAKEPRMLYFACHLSDDRTRESTVQIHADADNMGFHMELVADHIRTAAEYLDWTSMSIQIYGSPSDAVLEQMRQIAGSGVTVTISPAAVAFDRLPAA